MKPFYHYFVCPFINTVNFSMIPFDSYFVHTMECVSCLCLKVANLWEWAIASHGRLLVPPGWLQVTCVGHCSICQSEIFLAHRQCSIRAENLINCGTALSKDLAVSG